MPKTLHQTFPPSLPDFLMGQAWFLNDSFCSKLNGCSLSVLLWGNISLCCARWRLLQQPNASRLEPFQPDLRLQQGSLLEPLPRAQGLARSFPRLALSLLRKLSGAESLGALSPARRTSEHFATVVFSKPPCINRDVFCSPRVSGVKDLEGGALRHE